MHSAPAVAYPVRRSCAAGLYLLAACSFSVAVSMLWLVQAHAGWLTGLGVLCCVLGCIGCGMAWRAMPEGELAWNGEVWELKPINGLSPASPALPCRQLAVVLDLQRHFLFRWPGRGITGWVWLDQSSQPLRWHALRCAVYSPARYAEGSLMPSAVAAAS